MKGNVNTVRVNRNRAAPSKYIFGNCPDKLPYIMEEGVKEAEPITLISESKVGQACQTG